MSRIIGIISGKGGVGKTVVAINLSAALYKYYRKSVLLVDCNITTSHVGLYLGLYSTPATLNDALKDKVPIEKCIYEHSSGINVIPASLKLEDLKDIDWHAVKDKLSSMFNTYDFVILDSSPGFNKESLITLGTCKEAVVVTTPIVHTVADAIKCRILSEEVGVKTLGVAMNMIRKKKYELGKEEVVQMTGMNVIASIPYDEKINESIISKSPVIYHRSRANMHFKQLAAYLVGEQVQQGFLSRVASAFGWA